MNVLRFKRRFIVVAVSSDCGAGERISLYRLPFPLPESSLVPWATEEAGLELYRDTFSV